MLQPIQRMLKFAGVLAILLALQGNASVSPVLAATPTPTAADNPYIVVAQLNLWYFGTGCHGGFEAYNCSGKRTTPLIPALNGEFNVILNGPERAGAINLVLNLQGLVFNSYGEYAINLAIDRQEMASLPFWIRPAPSAPENPQ